MFLVLCIVLVMSVVLVLSIILVLSSIVLVLVPVLGPIYCPGPYYGPSPCPDLKLLVLCRSIIVIGAPTASNNQSGVEKGGAVYLCPWNTEDVTSSMCDVINLDATGLLRSLLLEALVSLCLR